MDELSEVNLLLLGISRISTQAVIRTGRKQGSPAIVKRRAETIYLVPSISFPEAAIWRCRPQAVR